MKSNLLCFLCCLICSAPQAQTTLQWSDSRLVDSTMSPITSPRVTLLSNGTPLVTWGVSSDNGSTSAQIWCSRFEQGAFSSPIGVVQTPDEPALFGFGGYDVAVSDNQVFVVFEQLQKGIFLARSDDGGLTFGLPTSIQGPISGGYTTLSSIVVDGTGNPVVSYIQYKNGKTTYEVRRSSNGGVNFGASVTGNAPAPGGEVCECCTSDLIASGDSVWLLFRNNNQNRRDIWVSRSIDLAASFETATDVDATDWQLSFCPIAGPRMARSGDSLITVWVSGAGGTGRVYLSTIHSGTMQAGLQLGFPTPSAPLTVQSQADVAAVLDTVGIVFVEKSREIVFHFSTNGAAGLTDESTRFAVQDHILHLPSLAFGSGGFHLVYVDATAGQVLYKQGVLAGSSPVNEAIEALDIAIFPNPGIAGFFLVKSAAYELQEVSMFNSFGEKILTQKASGFEIKVPTANFPEGVYFLKIKTFQGEVSRAIVVW